jgi:hypothetical protein
MTKSSGLVPVERIERCILLIRGQKVMLDKDLAVLYGVQAKALNQAVKRSQGRFPDDFMFQLTWEETQLLRSQIVTLNDDEAGQSRSQSVTLKRGSNIKYRPYAFTEQGVAMLSSVLRSERAVAVNVEIMRAFVRLRQMLGSHEALARKIENLEKKYDSRFKVVFDALRALMEPPATKRRPIGFHARPEGS